MALLYEDKTSAIAVMDREIEKLEGVIHKEFWKQFIKSSFYAVLWFYALSQLLKVLFSL